MGKKLRMTGVDLCILFFVGILGLSQVVNMAGMVLDWKFHVTSKWLGVGLIAWMLLAGGLVWGYLKNYRQPGSLLEKRTMPLYRQYPVYCALIGGLVLFQIIWNFLLRGPYVEGDLTIETVQTILATDTVYQYNPLTGEAFTAGMPSRLKLLVLPVLYSALVKWTGLPAQKVVYELVPVCTLCLSYLVYGCWSKVVFPNSREKQCRFVLFVAVLYQFGAYGPLSDGMRVLQSGFTGESIRALVLLPYVLLSCMQRKWLQAVLGALAEACVVWTLYGLGYSVVMILCMALLWTVWDKKWLQSKKRGGNVS